MVPSKDGADASAVVAPRRVVFVTGRLAETSLRRVLDEMAPPFEVEVAVLGITVAALMTPPWIARHLAQHHLPDGVDLIVLPGLCDGDLDPVAHATGVRVERGPKDLRDIPRYFGRSEVTRRYGEWDIEIIAEINHAPRLTLDQVLNAAENFRDSGADIIDIGCLPGVPFPGLADTVRQVIGRGMRVSIDTFDRDEIRTAVSAGAELVLSVNESNVEVASEIAGSGARVVVVPSLGEPVETIEPTLEKLAAWNVPYLVDPILEPIGHGFMASLQRYADVRRRFADVEMLMGIGNVTELTAADTTGVNALLIAICQELGVRTVLTTEVIPWARGAVREIDIARRLMHFAVTEQRVPKGVDDRLVTVKDPDVLAFTEAELRTLQAAVTDPNYRIFTDRERITVFNSERFVRGTDIQDIFGQLDVKDASHAFYLGKELARASLAVTLGKTYRQEGALCWGYLTPPDDANAERVKLTQRVQRSADSSQSRDPVEPPME